MTTVEQETLPVTLKPCPFCGAHDEFYPSVSQSHKYAEPGDAATGKVANLAAGLVTAGWYVECDECGGLGGQADDRAAAITAWNTRADHEPRVVEVGLREAAQRLLTAMAARAVRGRDHVPSMRDEQDAAGALRTALATHSPTPMAGEVWESLQALITDVKNGWGDPHTLRNAEEAAEANSGATHMFSLPEINQGISPCRNPDCPNSDPFIERDCGTDARIYCKSCGRSSGWVSETADCFARDSWNTLNATHSPAPTEGEGWRLGPVGDPVSLNECPPGPFEFNSSLGFKTEYGAAKWLPERDAFTVSHWPDPYCLDSGEAFWGGALGQESRAALVVQPLAARPSTQPQADAGSADHSSTREG